MVGNVKAELKAWRGEWVPALLCGYLLVHGLIDWDPKFTAPWLLAAVGLFLLARAGRKVQANSSTDGASRR